MYHSIFGLIFFLVLWEQFDCELVIIRAANYDLRIDNTKVLEVCSLYRGPLSYIGKYREPLRSLSKTFNPCDIALLNDTIFKKEAVYFKINKNLECDLKSFENSFIAKNFVSIIGLDNSIVLKISNSSKNEILQIPFLFLPNSKSRVLEEFLQFNNNTYIDLYRREAPFDVSILIVVAIGILGLLAGSLWHRQKFIKE